MTAAHWTKARIEALIAAEDFGGARIELPFGLATRGWDPGELLDAILPVDLTGKSVLDAASGCGALCFYALKRGASKAVGYDAERETVRKARLLADVLESGATFEIRDIVRRPPEETFDYVICLGVLHHLRSPLAVLDRLLLAARERVVFDLRSPVRWPFLSAFRARFPIIHIGRNGSTGKHRRPKFRFTDAAANILLTRHRSGVVDVETRQVQGSRLAIAHKRRIEHLIVVAGPVAAGKSHFCQRLRAGDLPAVARQLGLAPGEAPSMLRTNLGHARPDAHVKTALFHYGFLRPYRRRARSTFRDEALDVLYAADKLTFVTIWAEPDALVERITRSEIDTAAAPSERHLALREEYRDPARVREHYERWIAFAGCFGVRHWVAVDEGPGTRLLPLDAWRRERTA